MGEQRFLRPAKRIALNKWYESGFKRVDTLNTYSYEDATILPLRKTPQDGVQFGRGGVIADGEYISHSGIEGRVGGYYGFQDAECSDSRVVYCGALIRHWGHFLVESVSRLWYSLKGDTSVDKYVFISNSSNFPDKDHVRGNYREFLELLGVWDKIEILTKPTRYKEVLIPELGYSRKYYYSNEYKAIFQKVTEEALKMCHIEGGKNERVFLSRSQCARADVGLDMLDHYFSKNCFKILFPEELSLHEMIWYLQDAETCAAESGTLPHNFLFCQDGKDCVIVERQTTVNEIQANVDIIKSLNVTYIDGHFLLYPTSAGFGPYFICYNSWFDHFTKERGYSAPEQQYLSDTYLRRNLRRFFSLYEKAYGYQWGFECWQLMYADAYYEAYEDTCKQLGPYLRREKALFLRDYFSIHYLKVTLRRILNN